MHDRLTLAFIQFGRFKNQHPGKGTQSVVGTVKGDLVFTKPFRKVGVHHTLYLSPFLHDLLSLLPLASTSPFPKKTHPNQTRSPVKD